MCLGDYQTPVDSFETPLPPLGETPLLPLGQTPLLPLGEPTPTQLSTSYDGGGKFICMSMSILAGTIPFGRVL